MSQQLLLSVGTSESANQTNETLEQTAASKIGNKRIAPAQQREAAGHLLRLLRRLLQALLLAFAVSWRHLRHNAVAAAVAESRLRSGRAVISQLATTASRAPTSDAKGQMSSADKPEEPESRKNLVQLTSTTKIAAGFDCQLVASELSASLISEALESIKMSQLEEVEASRVVEVTELPSEQIEEQETISTLSSSSSSSAASSHQSSGSSSSTSYEDFCGQQASELNLRQLRLEALQDVGVCGQQRQSTESARRLFNMLLAEPSRSAAKRAASSLKAASSMGSRSGEDEEDDGDDEEELMQFQHQHNNNVNNLYDDIYAARSDTRQDDYGTIKISRRCCTSASSTNGDSTLGGRTLVCSVSPISQLGGGSGAASVNGDPLADDSHLPASYSVDGDEIRHCRAAFRQNRRLIEAQSQALLTNNNNNNNNNNSKTPLSRSNSQSRWMDSLSRRQRLPNCAHCHKPLYPTDRMELDFTRNRLNLHRNCFKCQVCSTMLRLETYASIDAKLYCPAHTKCAVSMPISDVNCN